MVEPIQARAPAPRLEALQPNRQVDSRHRPQAAGKAAPSFAKLLASEVQRNESLRFSAHALRRLESRDIAFSEGELGQITRALDQAAAKGARESLFLMDQVALVVSVPNRTVITAVPRDDLDGNVFTNIDSAVVIPAIEESPTLTETQGPAPSRGGLHAAERLTRRTA